MYTNDMTKKVFAGKVPIGGGAPVTVQSMLCVPAHDITGNTAQAMALEKAGCDIVRIAVPDTEAVKTLAAVKESVNIPVVADIHFDYKLALESVAAGADKIRINPGNIGSDDRVKAVADACRTAGVPIRIGVNSGSVEKIFLRNTALPRPRRWSKAVFTISLCLKNTILTILYCRLKARTPYRCTARMCSRRKNAVIRFISA